jgi:hypothetical protein
MSSATITHLTKYQHYYPCATLVRLSNETHRKKAKIKCLFADRDVPVQVPAEKIGGERHLYEPLSLYPNEIENLLTEEVDNKFSTVLNKTFFRKLMSHKEVTLTSADLKALYAYCYSLMLRHPSIVKNEEAMKIFLPSTSVPSIPLAYGNFLKNFLKASSDFAYKTEFWVTQKAIPVNLSNPVVFLPTDEYNLPKLLVVVSKNIYMTVDTSQPVEEESKLATVYYEETSNDSSLQAIDYLLSKNIKNSTYVFGLDETNDITDKIKLYRDQDLLLKPVVTNSSFCIEKE